MKLRMFVALLALVSVTAWATSTWSTAYNGDTSVLTCTTGTEAAPTLATQGLDLSNIVGFTVTVESTTAADGGYVGFGAGSLLAYVYDPVSGRWNRDQGLDQTVTTSGQGQTFAGFKVPARRGRIAFIPSGLNTPVVVRIHGTRY